MAVLLRQTIHKFFQRLKTQGFDFFIFAIKSMMDRAFVLPFIVKKKGTVLLAVTENATMGMRASLLGRAAGASHVVELLTVGAFEEVWYQVILELNVVFQPLRAQSILVRIRKFPVKLSFLGQSWKLGVNSG
jgi:hypothetical protein